MNENDIQKLIDKKREEFRKFDSKSPEEQKRLTEQGLNPHDKPEVRKRKAAAYLEKEKRAFDKLPKKEREIRESIGWSPYQQDTVVCRSTEYFAKHGTYVVDVGKKTE